MTSLADIYGHEENLSKVVINGKVIEGEGKPKLHHKRAKRSKKNQAA